MVRLGYFSGVLIGVDEGFPVQNVDVQVVGPLAKIAGEDAHQVVHRSVFRLAQGLGSDGEGVGNAVPAGVVGELWPPSSKRPARRICPART